MGTYYQRLMAFNKFHQKNPHVYRILEGLALKVFAVGHEAWSLYNLYEKGRWDLNFKTTDKKFKLNNNHAPFYARLILRNNPQLPDGFFKLKEQSL